MIQSPVTARRGPSSVAINRCAPSALTLQRPAGSNAAISSQLPPRHCTARTSIGLLRKNIGGLSLRPRQCARGAGQEQEARVTPQLKASGATGFASIFYALSPLRKQATFARAGCCQN